MKDFWPHKFPLILGWDLSGVVEELGRGVSRFKIGDEVYNGAYADYIVVRESELPTCDYYESLFAALLLSHRAHAHAHYDHLLNITESECLIASTNSSIPVGHAERRVIAFREQAHPVR